MNEKENQQFFEKILAAGKTKKATRDAISCSMHLLLA